MQRIGRAPFMIAAAIILPLLIFLGIQLAFQAGEQRDEVEAEALERTEMLLVEADGALQRTLGALDMISGGSSVVERDWRTLYERLLQSRRREPGWVTVLVTDLRANRVVFDLRRPFGDPVDARGFEPPAHTTGSTRAFVGNVGGSGPGCPCALVYRFIEEEGTPAFLITVAMDSRPFYQMVARTTDRGRVFGLVDRNGNFVARSLDHSGRVGTPATQYVQRAIRGGRSGIYLSRTWEGFRSYTAFNTSNLSGWSAHIAFRTGLIDSPRWRSFAAGLFAALASLTLALVLVWYVLRELARGRQMQERLQDAQKMEALGQITGGIAHDFNNLLTPIVGGLGIVARQNELDPGARRLIESALSASRRAAKLTGQLLAFSRRQKMQIAAVDLVGLFAEIRPLLEQSAGPAIKIRMDVAEDARCAATDANQLELALLNLLLNARDAMPNGGMVNISARRREGRRAQAAVIDIEVRDDGEGMAAHVLRRATEPFFTTKGSGSGTGLGLAQVYGIVSQSGGTMAINSDPGDGTVVTLSLPACELPVGPVLAEAEEAAVGTEAATATILVCDDDDAVRGFVAGVLEDAGFAVEAVADGVGAVKAVRNGAADLLVVDFAMHGMNGADVAATVRAFRPDLPVLMITGYADTETVASLAPGIPMLRKPFEAGALLAAVGEALGSGSKTEPTG
jgi:signal transduction histidine kinase/ActR/RegA family two-component response regulator